METLNTHRDEVRQLIERNAPPSFIAGSYNVSPVDLWSWMQDNKGFLEGKVPVQEKTAHTVAVIVTPKRLEFDKKRRTYGVKRGTYHKFLNDNKETIVGWLKESSIKEIAEVCHVSYSALHAWVVKNNIPFMCLRDRSFSKKVEPHKDEIFRMLKSGLSTEFIAKKFGVKEISFKVWLARVV